MAGTWFIRFLRNNFLGMPTIFSIFLYIWKIYKIYTIYTGAV